MPAISTEPQAVRLTLRWNVLVENQDSSLCLLCDEDEYRFEGVDTPALHGILNNLDGTKTTDQIIASTSAPPRITTSVLTRLREMDLVAVVDPSEAAFVDSVHFTEVCEKLYIKWKSRLFGHSLWVSLGYGSASPNLFAGWLLESFHFIEGANIRLSFAAAQCSNKAVQGLFAHHYAEEYDHFHFYLKSLVNLGIMESWALNSDPLPGTKAVQNFMRRCAREDPLQYAICSGLLESTGTDRERARKFYENLTTHYAMGKPQIVSPMAAHTDLDEEYGHNGVLPDICARIGPITVERANATLQAGYSFLETLELWSTDIEREYGQHPRLPRGIRRYRAPAI